MPRVVRIVSLVLLAFLALLGPSSASATQVEAMSMRALVTEADIVVVGTIVSSDAHYDDLDRIVTDQTVRIEETLHGERRETLVLRRLGGVVGDVGLLVSGEVSHPDGTRLLLFLRRLSPADLPAGQFIFRPLGMSQGVLSIVQRDGVEVVLPGGADVALVSRRADGTLAPAVGALTAPEPRDALLARVRDLVSEVHGE